MIQALRIRARLVSMFSSHSERFVALTAALLCAANLHLLWGQNIFPATGDVGSGSATPASLPAAESLKPRVITGTMNYIPYFTDNSNDLGNSALYQSGGNVGIGTSSPGTKLSVVSSGSIDGLTLSSVNRSSIWFTTTGVYNRNWLLQNAVSSNTDFQFLASTTVGGTPTTSVMTLLASGNVGIGTTSPQHPLHVAGTIGAEEVIVSSTGADYVFDRGYRLAPLTEIAAYINENHHLPDIPSASEIQQEGASVGEMQAKLLAKIEELTLHMILRHDRPDASPGS